MVLAESLLCETPVLTLSTPWGDNSQGEVSGGHGIGGFEAVSLKEFDNYCRRLISDNRLRSAMGKRGRQHIIEKYNSHLVAEAALQEASCERKIIKSKKPKFPLSAHVLKSFGWTTKLLLNFFQLRFYTRYTTGYLSWMNFYAEHVRNCFKRLRGFFT